MSTTMLTRVAALACLVAGAFPAFDAHAQSMVQTFPTKPVTIIVPDVRQKLAAAGIEPAGGTAAQFGEFIQVEMVKWAKVAKDAGIKPE